MSSGSRWCPVAPSAIAWREWDDQLVLYSHVTGNTHQLDSLGGKVMLALLRNPSGIRIAEIVRGMSIESADGDSHLAGAVERALVQLAELRLAAREPA